MAAWVFLSLPLEDSAAIRAVPRPPQRGFGSLRVRVTIGATTWTTSIFPEKNGPYVLPVKKSVRVAESLEVGDHTEVTVEVLN